MTIKMTFSTIKPLLYHKKRVKPHPYIPLSMTLTLYFNAYVNLYQVWNYFSAYMYVFDRFLKFL